MGKGNGNIGKSILDKKSYTLLPPKEQKNFEQFQKKRRQSTEEQEETVTSQMPEEPEPSSDKLVADRAKLYQEKNNLSNHRKALENIGAEDSE
jgi:hypothetical protein